MSGRTISEASMTFAKEKRIRKRRDFLRVQRFGCRSFGRFVVIVAQRSANSLVGKVGITVPKKVGAAHIRNKIKRRIRHIFRLKPDLFLGKSLVIIARVGACVITFRDLESDIITACQRLKLDQKPGMARPRKSAVN
jgi:ribonuclease P protein component